MEVNKLLLLDKFEKTFNLHLQVDFKGLFHTTTTLVDTYMDIVSRELVGFQHFPIDVKSCKWVLFWL
jgi:hypothetical protein